MRRPESAYATSFSMMQTTKTGDLLVTADFALATTGRYEICGVHIRRADGGSLSAVDIRSIRVLDIWEARAVWLQNTWPDDWDVPQQESES